VAYKVSGQQEMDSRVTVSQCVAYSEELVLTAEGREIVTAELKSAERVEK